MFDRAIAKGRSGGRMPADYRMIHFLLESTRKMLRMAIDQPMIASRRRRNTGVDQVLDRVVEIALGGPGPQVLIDLIVRRASPAMSVECGVRGPRGITERKTQRVPMRVALARDRQPLFAATARIQALRRGPRAAIAFALHCCAIRAELDDLLGRGVQRTFYHRGFDMTAHAGAIALHETHDRGEGGVHAGERITGTLLDAGLIVEMTRQPCETGDLFHRLREADVVAPGSVEAERRHPHQHRAGIDLAEVVTGEPEAFEHTR